MRASISGTREDIRNPPPTGTASGLPAGPVREPRSRDHVRRAGDTCPPGSTGTPRWGSLKVAMYWGGAAMLRAAWPFATPTRPDETMGFHRSRMVRMSTCAAWTTCHHATLGSFVSLVPAIRDDTGVMPSTAVHPRRWFIQEGSLRRTIGRFEGVAPKPGSGHASALDCEITTPIGPPYAGIFSASSVR